MSKYELRLNIIGDTYIDQLIVALVRQGYSVYYNADDNVVCTTVDDDDDLEKLKE